MKHVTSVIDIPASPERVWAALVDTASYPRWNPFITKFAGELTVGQRLDIRIAPPPRRSSHGVQADRDTGRTQPSP